MTRLRRAERVALGILIAILGFDPGVAGFETAWAAGPDGAGTLFEGVVSSPHHLALSPEDSCLLCHTGGQTPAAGNSAQPRWAEKSRIPPFTLDAQPVLGADPDYHPSGSSTACLACHDGVLAINVHGVSPEVGRRGGNVEGLRMTDHPDSILYPRRPNGTFVTERTPPHISRYFSIPDRAAAYGESRQTIEMPQGPVSSYLFKTGGLASVGPDSQRLLVRTSAGRIQCDSCHNPHTNRFAPFLRGSPRTLCLVCHDR